MLTITVRFRFGTYDAGAIDDPRRPEWPPHPARVFCALVAGTPDEAEWAALRWLEAQAPPEVHAPLVLDEDITEAFLVNNLIGGVSPSLPARTGAIRIKPRSMPAKDRFHLVWPDAAADEQTVGALQRLAWRVPYLGRSTSSAEVDVAVEAPRAEASIVYELTTPRDGELGLRVPYDGYCDRLSDAFDAGALAWEVSRWADYRIRPQRLEPTSPTVPSPFEELLIFGFVGIPNVHGSLVGAVADCLRKATQSLLPDPPLPAISGHGADGATHVAYLGLPNVGTPATLPEVRDTAFVARNLHADGRLLGVALALPGDEAVSNAVYRHLTPFEGRGLDHLTLGASGRITLGPPSTRSSTLGLQPHRWVRPSRWWATATPLTFDRYARPNRHDAPQQVREALVTAGYPAPEAVYAQRSPVVPGGVQATRSQVQRRAGTPVKPRTHAWVRFPEPVRGPVVAGSMRYRGFGLFIPLQELDDPANEGDAAAEEAS